MNEERIKFHIEANDYFGTLTTVLDLVAQGLRKHSRSHRAETLLRLRDELIYLQNRYRIEEVGH